MRTLILLDWDDTLFPTSWVSEKKIDLTNEEIQNKYLIFFSQLDLILYKLLKRLTSCGTVIIVTNAMKQWVRLSSAMLPSVNKLLEKNIKIISAREQFQHEFPTEIPKWKKLIFKRLIRELCPDSHNIISAGDASHEFLALINLHDNSKDQYLKTIRFIPNPPYDILIDQLEVLFTNAENIVNKKRHLDLKFNN